MTIWKSLFGGKLEPARQNSGEAGTPDSVTTARHIYPFSDPAVRLAAIGDIHGRADLLSSMFRQLDALAADGGAPLKEIYLGDYIDRGPGSKAVLQMLRDRVVERGNVTALIGNHEELLVRALADNASFERWIGLGGRATLASYCPDSAVPLEDTEQARLAFAAAFPVEHLAFLASMSASYSHREFFFAHAGVRPGVPLSEQSAQDLRWIREPFLSFEGDFGAIVVHGHTPDRQAVFKANRVCIDTGAFHTGRLTALVIDAGGTSLLEAAP